MSENGDSRDNAADRGGWRRTRRPYESVSVEVDDDDNEENDAVFEVLVQVSVEIVLAWKRRRWRRRR